MTTPIAAAPAPTTPYPGDPNRSAARCAKHGNPCEWDGEWRCARGNDSRGGHTPHEIFWGKPARRTSGGRRRSGGGRITVLLGELEPAVRELAETHPRGINGVVIDAVARHVKSRRRKP